MPLMTAKPVRIAAVRSSVWNRMRFQLTAGLLIAVFLPYFVRLWLGGEGAESASLWNSLLGAGTALLMGYYGFRRSSQFPGVMQTAAIVSCFTIAYVAVLLVFFFARLDYSRAHFGASYLLCVGWYYVVYALLQRQRGLQIGVVPFGEVDQLHAIAGINWIKIPNSNRDVRGLDAVVADLRADIPDKWETYLADCALEGVLVLHVKQLTESLTGCVQIDHLSENNFGSLIPGIVYAKLKRAGDLAGVALALPILAPLLLIAAVLIRLDSPGPVLFRQKRMGYRGRTFTVFKLRTMLRDAPPEDERAAAMTRSDDDRVTRIGKVLRRYRIDELPQVINILRGEMSWIGPRPEAVPLSSWYEKELPFYRYRHIVRPGITGWAQVNQGHVAEVDDVLWKLRYDFYYVKNYSFWLDLLIVARTIKTVLSGFGAR